jgi:2-haloalkanoic acid dehalogenase type II
MDLNGFTTLSFDCYGTLIDWETGLLAELRPWASRHGVTLADEALLEAFGPLEAEVQRQVPTALYPEVLAEVHRRLAARLGAPADEEAARRFGASVGHWPAFSDTPAALSRLAHRYRLAILSNVDRDSFARSNERLGVTFDFVFTAQDIGSYKPARANFDYLVTRLGAAGIARGAILHVAQSLFHDIQPARTAGLATCWVNRRRGKAGHGATPAPAGVAMSDIEVADLAQLAGLLVPRAARR